MGRTHGRRTCLPCGCSRRIARRRGHRPLCPFYDQQRWNGQRRKAAFRSKLDRLDDTVDHVPGVIL